MLRKLEKYEIEEEIGHGGMATVYRAHDTVLDRAVALKVMHPHLRGAEEARRRFHREAQSVARLRHPRVLEIYDFSGEGSDEAYIAAELLTGPTLKQWREDHHDVPAEIAACFVIEIASALEAAHDAKIIHRDVKPENVLLHEERTLKLTDFGIADMVDAQSMTATGQILGSPGHMAPEQIEGKDTDTRTDLFSLGTVLYYLATGQLPFTGRNPHQVLKRIVDSEYADPLRVNPTIGGRMREIIVKALERDPADRHQTAAELRDDLIAFVRDSGIEDIEQTLAAYLGDPDTIGEELTRETIERLLDRGSRASDAGDVPTALDCFNRVLALDEGNERVMKLIERVGLDRRRRTLMLAGAAMIIVGLAAGGGAYAVWTAPPEPVVDADPDPPTIVSEDELDAGLDGGTTLATQVSDAGNSSTDATVALVEGLSDAGRPTRVVVPGAGRPGPRTVRLQPNIVTVRVRIDDGPTRELDEVRTVELEPGPHTITLIPPADLASYYRRATIRIRVPRGSGVHHVPPTQLVLPLKDGGISVNCGVAGATVTVATTAGTARGHCGEMIAVPMPSVATIPEVRVIAPGRPMLRVRNAPRIEAGGRTEEITVSLPEPDSAAP